MRRKKTPIIAVSIAIVAVSIAIIAVSIAILLTVGTTSPPEQFTVSEVWASRDELEGQRITARGYFGWLETQQTRQACKPNTCNCNATRASRILLYDGGVTTPAEREVGVPPKHIVMEILDCRGDECVMICRPINPETRDELEFTGVLHIAGEDTAHPYLMLEDVELENARQKVNEDWQPVSTGFFEVTNF